MLATEKDTNSDRLYGRQWLLDELKEWYESGSTRAVLSGPPGVGKSRLAKEFAQTIPGAMVIDFSLGGYGMDWPPELSPAALGGRVPTLLVIDSVEYAPPVVWRSRRLNYDFPGIPVLFCYRPGIHHESLLEPGCRQFELNPADPRHRRDLAGFLEEHAQGHYAPLISTFREAEFLTKNPTSGAQTLAAHYVSLWRETTRSVGGATRILMEQLALLLADTPEPLPFGALSDFTGIPLVQILEAVDHLSPLLSFQRGGLTIFSPGLAGSLKTTFSRDLGAVHGRVVSFFRDTYPTWGEMHDPYGWRYLVLHCDRLARASRKKDFSILHWLNEGSFSILKLERTGMLPSVLKDLRLSLLASLESSDIPRIVSFGCRIARLRKHESVKTVHRLADAGMLELAQENGHLISGESERFLVWLLFATQTLEANDFESTYAFVAQALTYATVDLNEMGVELAASLLAGMLGHRALSEEGRVLLEQALSMHGHPLQATLAFRAAARHVDLSRPRRKQYLEKALQYAHQLNHGKQKLTLLRELESRLARMSKDGDRSLAYPLFIADSKNPEKEFAKCLKQVAKHDMKLATLAAALIPVSADPWVNEAFVELAQQLKNEADEDSKKHALAGLIQSLEDSSGKDLPARLLDLLSEEISALPEAADRSLYFSRLAVFLTHKDRPLEAQQRISLAAANAFSIMDPPARAVALVGLAENVALTGALRRARDLAFHALELRSRLQELHLESQQLVRLLSDTSAQSNQSAEEIVRLGSSLRFEDTPIEMEAKGRAMVVLAAGLSRLGSEHHAALYRSKAAEAVRSIEEMQLRIHLLSDLASAFHHAGEEKEARKLLKEARTLFDDEAEARGLLSATALLKLYVALENRSQTKKLFQVAREMMEKQPTSEWLSEPAFLDFLTLAQGLGRVQEVLPALNEPRRASDLSDLERLGVLRAEIRLKNFPKAEAHAEQLKDLVLRCHAHIDLALSMLAFDAERAIHHLTEIPLESFRCEGIRKLALANSAEIRPTEQVRVKEVLCQLTLLAAEHPDAMDSVLSRWIQACPDRETLLAIADKMNWTTGAPTVFRQAMESRPAADFEEQATEDEEVAEEESDDGFRAVSLTKKTVEK